MSPKELTVFLRSTEAEDRGSRKLVGVKKEGDAEIMDFSWWAIGNKGKYPCINVVAFVWKIRN